MMKLKAERFEGTMVICTDKEKKFFAIEKAELPKDVKIGSFIDIDDDGNITVSEAKSSKKH